MITTVIHPHHTFDEASKAPKEFIERILSFFTSTQKGTSLMRTLQQDLMEISIINKPQDILHFWHRIAVLKDQLNENIRRSATHGYSRSTYKIDVENKIFLERLDMELQHIFHQYVEYFSGTDTNISLLRDAFQSKNRLQVVRTQKISLLAKVILPYISKSNKSRNDWQMLVENMTDFFDTLGAYKNNQKELLSSERSVSVQERVDTILKNSQTVFSPDISPKSILPEKNDRLLAEEIAQARERDDTLALNRLSQEMMQRLEENEFPPSADARKEFDFRSSTLMDHIADKETPDVSLISPENPLLMDTLEWGPVEITKIIPYPEGGAGQYEAVMTVRGRPGHYLLDASSIFVGELTAPKVLGIFDKKGKLHPAKNNYFTVKYFQFKHPEMVRQKRIGQMQKNEIGAQETKKSSLWNTIRRMWTSWRGGNQKEYTHTITASSVQR